jgi:autoinducer 2-binding protein LuxP
MNDDNGIAMAEAIRMDLTGRGDSVPSVYSGDFKLVDRTTSSTDMAQLRAYAFR